MCLVMASEVQQLPQEGGDDGATGSKKTDLQQHLQAMFALLPQHHILKEAVRLESVHKGRVRYLAVVSCCGCQSDEEETCVLGFDCVEEKACTLGLVLCLYADSSLTLDGDGGFSLCSTSSQHVFKPVSVHVLWAVIQSLHKACTRAQKFNHYAGGTTHRWVESYRITSDRSCLNEWHYLPDVESRRPSSPLDQKADRERLIRAALKEVMMTLDLDVVTSKDIRRRVEEELQLDLTDHKSFLDQEMLTILGQMDGASKIFDNLYLGSEWNASNLEELERNGIGHILNVTREIDNFFPDQFDYLNVRVYDDEATELLKHWDRTFKYIRRATEIGSRVLVHCKMGVSRSASVVIAYAMKAHNLNLPQALEHVKVRRACVKPNASFMHQLEIYAGILDASKHRHNHLWRSKSETNLQSTSNDSSKTVANRPFPTEKKKKKKKPLPLPPLPPAPLPIIVNDSQTNNFSGASGDKSVQDEDSLGRPKSWSPDDSLAESYFPSTPSATAVTARETEQEQQESDASHRSICVSLRVPCSNGRTYSVSQNRAVQLESSPPPPPPFPPSSFSSLEPADTKSVSNEFIECFNPFVLDPSSEMSGSVGLPRVGSVKDRIYELETAAAAASSSASRAGLILNLAWPTGSGSVEGISPGDTPLSAPVTSSGSETGSRDCFSARVDRVFENEERRQSDGSVAKQQNHHPVQQPEQTAVLTSSSAPLRQHSWGAAESRCDSNWMSSYASDPSLLSHVDIQPPSGLVRMQREALLEKASQPSSQQRRSLPDDTAPVATPVPQLNRSVSDTAGGGSVMRLRRELEAKAAFPLTGSYAPPPLVVAAFAASATSINTSPTRTNRPRPFSTIKAAGRKSLQRKRSLSLERVSFSGDALEDWNRAAQAAADEVDLNVKLLVGMFETPPRSHAPLTAPLRQGGERRPRGWSESGVHPRLAGQPQLQRRCQSPIVIGSLSPSPSTTPPIRDFHPQQQQQQQQQRKLYGKTHPLDRLVLGSSSSRQQQQKLAQQPVFGTM